VISLNTMKNTSTSLSVADEYNKH